MNKITKAGLTALCGSLAGITSVNAGEMTVTGGVDMSWMTKGGGDAVTGNPIGMGSNLTYKGSGELDNGWAFSLTIAMLNQDAFSSTAVNVDMGGLGKLNFNSGDSGNGIDAMDDKMPTAWEEPWGMGLGTGIQLVAGVGANSNVQYTLPTIGGITIVLATAPDMGGADVADKGASGATASDTTGAGYDATINLNPSLGTEILSGLNLFVGGHYTEQYVGDPNPQNDRYEAVGGITYSLGPIALGYQTSGIDTGANTTDTDIAWYKNHAYGIAFNINDDLSVSYGQHESQDGHVREALTGNESAHMEVTSWQVAYTLGGASIRYAEAEVDNASYQTGDTSYDKDARVISVSLAF